MTLALGATVFFSGAILLSTVGSRHLDSNAGAILAGLSNVPIGLLLVGLQGLFGPLPAWPTASGALGFAAGGLCGTFLGRWLFFTTIRWLGPTRATVFQTLSPLAAALMAWAFLGERLAWAAWVGMGLAALGHRHVLALTGDPSKFGDHPGATSVYDVNSLGLIDLIRQLNEGRNSAGREVGKGAEFVIGVAFNPNSKNFDAQVKKLERKMERGAHFVMTQPVYEKAMVRKMKEALTPLGIPVLVVHDLLDDEVPWDEGERFARHLTAARLLTTLDLGHHGVLNDPTVLRDCLRFLKGEAIGDKVVSSPNLPYGVT